MTVCTVSELEFLDDVIPEATAAQVSHTDALSVNVVVKDVLEVFGRKLIDDEKAFPQAVCLLLFFRQFTFLDFDVVFLGQPFQCFVI